MNTHNYSLVTQCPFDVARSAKSLRALQTTSEGTASLCNYTRMHSVMTYRETRSVYYTLPLWHHCHFTAMCYVYVCSCLMLLALLCVFWYVWCFLPCRLRVWEPRCKLNLLHTCVRLRSHTYYTATCLSSGCINTVIKPLMNLCIASFPGLSSSGRFSYVTCVTLDVVNLQKSKLAGARGGKAWERTSTKIGTPTYKPWKGGYGHSLCPNYTHALLGLLCTYMYFPEVQRSKFICMTRRLPSMLYYTHTCIYVSVHTCMCRNRGLGQKESWQDWDVHSSLSKHIIGMCALFSGYGARLLS